MLRQCAHADGAGTGRWKLAGYFGEGLRVSILPVCDLAVGKFGRTPVGGYGGEL